MIVYGDRAYEQRVQPGAVSLRARLELCGREPDPGSRLQASRALLIDAAALSQGLLDDAFERVGVDELSALSRRCSRLCGALGELFVCEALPRLWDARRLPGVRNRARARARLAIGQLQALASPRVIRAKQPEGFAFYAVYPELYAHAALPLRVVRPEHLQVIGIRSIGTALAPVVAAAAGATRMPWTVRPTGHPFARELHLGPLLTEALLQGRADVTYAVVDEGPGLSGSSFSAVRSWLVGFGVAPEQVVFLPSHAGDPGAYAQAEERRRYRATQRLHVSFEQVLLNEPREPSEPSAARASHASRASHQSSVLARWFAPTLSRALSPLQDLSAGRWRALFYPPYDYPASHVQQERRKYLLRTREGVWLLRFLGLGERSRRLSARAHALAQQGFCVGMRCVRHGFSAEPWLMHARPLPRASISRSVVIAHVGSYIGFLSRAFSVPKHEAGATPDTLSTMMKHNVRALLGEALAHELSRFDALLPALRASCVPTATDNKLDAHEWLVRDDGRLIKTDALDHHAGHDCIGCQDPAWDVVGASVELSLNEGERTQLLASVYQHARLRFTRDKLAFYELAYLAFRAGQAALAELSLEHDSPADAARMASRRQGYLTRLLQLLQVGELLRAPPDLPVLQ